MHNNTENNKSRENCIFQCSSNRNNDFDEELALKIDLTLSVVNTYYAFSSLLANGLVLYTFYKTPSLLIPQNIMLCCLAVTDFLIGLIAQPLFVVFLVARHVKACRIYMTVDDIFVILGYSLTTLSLMTITIASVEKGLSLYFPLRYTNYVTTRRLLVAELVAAIICFSGTLSAELHHDKNHTIFKVFDIFELTFIVLVNLVSFSYIYKVLRKEEKYIDSQWAIGTRLNNRIAVVRNSKSKSRTIGFMSGLSILWFIPHFIVTVKFVFFKEMTQNYQITEEFSITAMFVLATINPLLYSYRMENIRRPLRDVLNTIIASLQKLLK